MTLPQILRALWARRNTVLICALLLFGLAAAVSLVLPKTYKATADILIDLNNDQEAINKGQASHEAVAREVATQVDVIESPRVASTVVQVLKLDKDPAKIQEWHDATGGRGSMTSWLAQQLLEDLAVRPDADGSVIRVSYMAADPREAAEVANTVVQTYLTLRRELKINPALRNSEFFQERREQAREQLAAAKKQLRDYLNKHGLVDPTGKYDLENERLNELSQQLLAAENAAAEARARIDAGGRSTSQEVLANPVVQSLRQSVAQAESELAQMGRRLGSNHPTYRAQVRLVATLNSKLSAEISRQAQGIVNAGKISTRKAQEIAALLEAQRRKVIDLGVHRDAVELMNSDIKTQEEALEQLSDKSLERDLISGNDQTNASLLTPATEPGEPDSPKLVLNSVVAGILGALLGCLIALSRESSRPQIRSIDDLMDGFDLPVLVSLPDSASTKRYSGKGGGGGRALPQLSHLGASNAPRLEN